MLWLLTAEPTHNTWSEHGRHLRWEYWLSRHHRFNIIGLYYMTLGNRLSINVKLKLALSIHAPHAKGGWTVVIGLMKSL